ncbi:unnamed protein product [Caenorhabditis angaria]|uniref:Uncharacterized protein n=1 Tax=Caenorhabditis angaria TaxID=860376 RepID=A0A9P1IA19_9PELO|nr:unnamed protein product [Caenorhabditis angaria]
MPSTNLIKPDWEKDHVYLIQFPRAGSIPTPSSYSLKVETFLRIANIPYTNISNDFTKKSSKGQIPFIELNGRQHADSSLIIDHLVEHFEKTSLEFLSTSDKSTARAFYTLLEHHLAWITVYSRSLDSSWLATDKGYGRILTGVKGFAFKNLILGQMTRKYRGNCMAQGIGHFTKEEIIGEAKKDIDAISGQLGSKQFLFGDIKTIDATAFAHLSQLLYTPQFSDEIKNYIETSAPNVIDYINRIKVQYWPDWDETISTANMNTEWKKL